MRHAIRINQIGASIYCVTGAASILSTEALIAAPALQLREAGHPELRSHRGQLRRDHRHAGDNRLDPQAAPEAAEI